MHGLRAHQGIQLLMHCYARELWSKLSDASI